MKQLCYSQFKIYKKFLKYKNKKTFETCRTYLYLKEKKTKTVLS